MDDFQLNRHNITDVMRRYPAASVLYYRPRSMKKSRGETKKIEKTFSGGNREKYVFLWKMIGKEREPGYITDVEPPSTKRRGIMKKEFVCLLTGVILCGFAGSLAAQSSRYVEELTENLSRQIRSVQDENAQMALEIHALSRKTAALEKENRELSETVRQLKQQAAAESAARDEQIRKLSDQIVKLASLPPPAPVVIREPEKKKEAPEASYETYVVQQGATLSAIASAYNVSVQDIKKWNHLKSDFLQVGQKLKIYSK